MAGSNLGDDHKTFFAGDNALKRTKNTSDQFESKMNQNVNLFKKNNFYIN
jgi:isocitrate lyase